jgi:hypothetical protein
MSDKTLRRVSHGSSCSLTHRQRRHESSPTSRTAVWTPLLRRHRSRRGDRSTASVVVDTVTVLYREHADPEANRPQLPVVVELRHYTPLSIDPAVFCNWFANCHRDLQQIVLLASRQTVYLTRCCMACGFLEGHAFGFTTSIPFKSCLPTVRGSFQCSLNIGSNIASSGQYFGN